MESPETRKARKQAHRRALARLAQENPIEYNILLMHLHKELAGSTGAWIADKARGKLRELFPKQFHKLYNVEKKKMGLPTREYDPQTLDRKMRDLVRKGIDPSEIARRLGVHRSSVYRKMKQWKAEEEGNGKETDSC